MENNCIAVIYEGNKTERILIENLKKIFFLNRANIVFLNFLTFSHSIRKIFPS